MYIVDQYLASREHLVFTTVMVLSIASAGFFIPLADPKTYNFFPFPLENFDKTKAKTMIIVGCTC